jgi:hypothetical protein
MPQTTQSRTESHVAGEPAELFGTYGEPKARGVYSFKTPDGDDIWVAISSEGRVVASVEIPPVPQRDPGGLRAEKWHQSLARCWIALEVADPCEDASVFSYPDFLMT